MPDTTTPIPAEPSNTTPQPLAATGVQHVTISQEDIDRLKIPEAWIEKDPELIHLVLQTESMKDDERKYWFQLLPIMNDEQVQKLRGILEKEKAQLAELDKKYQAEVEKLNAKHMAELQLKKSQDAKKEIHAQEAASEKEEESAEADILSKIENM